MGSAEVGSVEDAVALLVAATGRRYELVGRLTGGETGAHEVAGPDGERQVLKWDTDPISQRGRRRGARLAERLRTEAGWPVPRQDVLEHDGVLLVVQELLPGQPPAELTHGLVDELLDLHERRLGLSVGDDDPDWPADLVRTLVEGGRGYCLHDSLRDHDERTRRLVERIEAIGRAIEPGDLPGGDVLHWDWHPGNILALDGQVSAVIDNDFVTTGDARFDLVGLAVASVDHPCEPGVRDRLRSVALDPLTDRQRAAYVGHYLLRNLDWPIRRGRTDDIERWLVLADVLLPDPGGEG